MKKKLWFLLPIIALLFGLFLWRMLLHSKGATPSVVSWLGHKTVWRLAEATRTEVFRLDPFQAALAAMDGSNDFKPGQRHIGPYLVVGTPQKQGQEFTTRLVSALFENFNTNTQNFSSCGFEPAVAFRLWHGEQSTDILLCFACDDLRIWTNEPGNPNTRRVAMSGDMEQGRVALLRLVKEVFPNDKVLQSLPDTHH